MLLEEAPHEAMLEVEDAHRETRGERRTPLSAERDEPRDGHAASFETSRARGM